MIYVYAIKSTSKNWIYVGMTDNIERRLEQHNCGSNKSTAPYKPFELFYSETFPDRLSARVREKYFKTAAGKRKLRKLISLSHGPV